MVASQVLEEVRERCEQFFKLNSNNIENHVVKLFEDEYEEYIDVILQEQKNLMTINLKKREEKVTIISNVRKQSEQLQQMDQTELQKLDKN